MTISVASLSLNSGCGKAVIQIRGLDKPPAAIPLPIPECTLADARTHVRFRVEGLTVCLYEGRRIIKRLLPCTWKEARTFVLWKKAKEYTLRFTAIHAAVATVEVAWDFVPRNLLPLGEPKPEDIKP